MSSCTCGAHKAEDSEPVEEIKVAPEAVEALNEPVREEDLNKEELTKDLEQTLAKLKEVMAYLAEMAEGEAKAEEPEPEAEEEEEEAEEDEEEDEEKSIDPKEKTDSLEKSLATLKKYGFNVYSGAKNTPAPKIDTPKAESIDWNNMEKSWDELEEMTGEN